MIIGVPQIRLAGSMQALSPWAFEIVTQSKGKAMLRAPNVWLDVWVHDTPSVARPVNALGMAHICVQSRDIDRQLPIALKGKVKPLSQPVDLHTGYLYLYAHTCDGMLIEMEGAPNAPEIAPSAWVGHVAFVCADLGRLSSFYAELCGLPASAPRRLNGSHLFDEVTGYPQVDLEAVWVSGLNIGLEFWHFHNPHNLEKWFGNGPQGIVFQTDDFEHDCARALKLGAQIDAALTDPQTLPSSAFFLDPEGNSFALLTQPHNDPAHVRTLGHVERIMGRAV